MDFQQHRQYKRSIKLLLRYIIYIVVLSFLLYLILSKEGKPEPKEEQIINFTIEQ